MRTPTSAGKADDGPRTRDLRLGKARCDGAAFLNTLQNEQNGSEQGTPERAPSTGPVRSPFGQAEHDRHALAQLQRLPAVLDGDTPLRDYVQALGSIRGLVTHAQQLAADCERALALLDRSETDGPHLWPPSMTPRERHDAEEVDRALFEAVLELARQGEVTR